MLFNWHKWSNCGVLKAILFSIKKLIEYLCHCGILQFSFSVVVPCLHSLSSPGLAWAPRLACSCISLGSSAHPGGLVGRGAAVARSGWWAGPRRRRMMRWCWSPAGQELCSRSPPCRLRPPGHCPGPTGWEWAGHSHCRSLRTSHLKEEGGGGH